MMTAVTTCTMNGSRFAPVFSLVPENKSKFSLRQSDPYFCAHAATESFGFMSVGGASYFANLHSGDEIDWVYWCKPTPSVRTGPSRDHTSADGKGCFAYIETSGRRFGERAWMATKDVMRGGQDSCSVTLWLVSLRMSSIYGSHGLNV